MKLRALHSRTWYKNDIQWLKAVYRKNKDIIGPTIEDGKPTFSKFKNLVMERKLETSVKEKYGKNVTTAEAVESLGNSEVFRTKAERMIDNAWKALTETKEDRKYIRQVAGWKTKLDKSNLVWSEKEGMYKYEVNDRRIWINFKNSPRGGTGKGIEMYQDVEYNNRVVAVK